MTKKQLQKKLTREEAKTFALNSFEVGAEIQNTLKKLGDDIIPKYKDINSKKKNAVKKELLENVMTILRAYENESRIALMESVNKEYWGLVKELTDQIQKEYECETGIEKALVGVIANAYVRILDNSRRLNNELNTEAITPNRNKYISNLSMQLDRANRQFSQAVIAMKQLKSPSIGINIKTDSAFISKNQHFNTEHKNNESK